MNEYLTELYNWLDANHSYSSRYTSKEFESNMQNEEFSKEMYSWLSSIDNTFAQREPIEQWSKKVKKKDESQPTSQEDATGSITKEKKQPTLLESSDVKVNELNEVDSDNLNDYFSSIGVDQLDLSKTEYSQPSFIDKSRAESIKKTFEDRNKPVDLGDRGISAAIDSGLISDKDLIIAGYKEPDKVSAITRQPSQDEIDEAKKKIYARRTKSSDEIDFAISQFKLDKPYVYEADSKGDLTFIESNFNTEDLAGANINVKDFDGFLESRGLKQDFLNKAETLKNKYGSIYDLELAKEMETSRMLDLYIREQASRDLKQQRLVYEKENGIDPNLTEDKYSFQLSENNVNLNKVSDYYKTHFPTLSNKLSEVDKKNKDLYNRYLNDEFGTLDFLKEVGDKGYEGFETRLQEVSASVTDFIGFSNTAQGIRFQMEQEKLMEGDNLSYSYVSGKKVNVDGKNYLVDKSNNVYDADLKIRVTNYLDENLKNKIIDESYKRGIQDSSISSKGMAFETASVLGDMAVQVGLQAGASGGLKAISAISKADKVQKVLGYIPKNVTELTKNLTIDRNIASSILAQGTLGAVSGYENTLSAAKEAGFNDKEAIELAREASLQTASLYALTAPISPQTKATEAIFGKIKGETIRDAINAYKKIGSKGFVEVFEKAGRKATSYLEEGLKETIQENIQQSGEVLLVNKNINELAGTKLLEDEITVDSFIQTSILSFTTGMLMPFAGDVIKSGRKKTKRLLGFDGVDRINALSLLSNNEDKLVRLLESQKNKGLYTEDEVNDLLGDVRVFKDNISKIPSNLTPNTALDVISDIESIRKLENKKENLDPSFHEDIDNQIKEIRESIKTKTKQDAIQKQETGDISDAKPAEGVQEMEEGVREPSVEEKRKEVEKRRQEELDLVSNAIATSKQTGEIPLVNGELVNKKTLDDINSKYDAELATLATEQTTIEEEQKSPIKEKSKTALKISSDTKTALDNKKTKQELTVDENGNTIVNEVEISKEDANLELDRLSLLAEKGRLTVDEFQKSYFGQSTDTNTLSEAKKQIESNPVEFINSIKKGFNETDTEQAVAEEVDERAYKAEEVKETTDAAAFAASQAEAIAQRKDDKLQVAPLTQQDAQKIIDEGGKLFMTEDSKAGAYVTADGYMGGLFKQPGTNRTQAAKVLQEARIKAGGKFFDAFGINVESGKGTNLEDIYIKNGFRPIARMTFNPEFAPKGWEKTNLKNRPDNVFFVYDPGYKATKGEGQRIEDYDQAYELAKNFSPEAAKVEEEVQKLRDMFKAPDQRKQVDNALNALSNIAPDVEIILHESEQAYAEATGETGRKQKTAGTYDETIVDGKVKKVIHINPDKANARTVAHEAFHAILLNMVKTDAEAQRLTAAMIKAVYKSAPAELKKLIDDFATSKNADGSNNYDSALQNEEKLSELIGYLATEYPSLPKPTKNVIKRWLDRLAKMFGMKPFTDSEVIDVLNTIAKKVSTGEAITDQDVSVLKGGKVVSNPMKLIERKSVGGFDVQYTEANKIQELKDENLLVEVNDVSEFSGLQTAITSPDDMLAGTISIDGNQIFEGGGGIFFVTKYGDVWASGKKGTANTLAKMINESLKSNVDRGLLVLTKGADQKLISSVSGVNSSLAILDVILDKELISPSDFRSAVSGAVKAAGGIISLSGSSKQLKSDINEYFSDPTTTTFEKRGTVVKDIIGRIAQSKSVKENSTKIIELLGGDTNKKLGKGKTKIAQSLGDLVAGVAAEQLTKGLSVGDVYGIIEVNSEVEVVEDSHPSYPFHVRLKDGSKPKLILPKNRQNGSEVLKTSTGEVYKVGNISIMSGSFNPDIKPTTRKRKQFVGEKANLTADQKASKKKAEELIKKGVDPVNVKQQTGFEVGVDGKIRLELDSSKAKEIGPGLDNSFGKTIVNKVLDFAKLFEAYPFIADIPIYFNDGFRSAGLYDGKNIRLNSRLIDEKGNGDYLGTLLHEIQHVIQIEEGFTGGGNPATIRKEVQKATRNLNNKTINSIQVQVEKLTGIRPELTITDGDRKELIEVYKNNEGSLRDMLSDYTNQNVDDVIKVIRKSDNIIDARKKLSEKFDITEDQAKLLTGIHSVYDMKLYEALSGEVEARNVQNRRTMTEAERRKSLAAETETISKLVSIEEDGGRFINVPIKRTEQIRRKQQGPGVDEIVRRAKENMVSDAAIRQYLKEEGYTDAEITAAMNIPYSEEIVERSEKAIKDRLKKRDFKGTMRYLRKKFFDRQTYIKDVLKGVGNKKSIRAHNRLVTKAGAKGFANYRFKKAEKEIFSNLSEKEKKQLDAHIYARRIVSINENRKKRGENEYVGAGGYNYSKAKSEVEAFSNDKLSKRADKYFEVFNQNLKRLRDSGRISEDVYVNLRDIEYSPIKTIKYIIADNYSASEINNIANSIGVSQKDIMALSDENVNDLITDSRWLLMMNIIAVENRSATNEVLNLFYDAIESADAEGLAAIGDNILDNPIVGNKESGAPKFKYDAKVPVGYRTVSFFKDGVEYKMVMREEYARQLLDIKVDDKTLKALRKFTFGNVLRFFATSGNPLFIVGNTMVDFQNILFLGDTYSEFKLVGGAELGFDFVKNSLKKMFNTGSYQKTYEEFMTYGGGMDFLSVDGIKAIKGISKFNKPKTLLQKGMVKWGEGLSYLGETSEMAFRLAVYEKTRSKLINQYKKENKKEPTGQDLEDILYESARESRETIDFSQGGDLVKSADYVGPYLNASVQGVRRAVDYASKNPGGFASSMIQYAVMSGGLLASSLYMLSSAFDDEEDEEEKARKMKDAWYSVSDYEKSAYHIIFTGDVDEDGEYEYYRFKKLPVIGSLSTVVEESIINQYLESKGIDYEFNTESVSKALDKTSPIGIADIGSRNPVISGVLSYVYNKDTFTGEEIFRGPRGKKILPEAEGILDNKVEQIYKDIAPALGMSPKRTQVMVEKVITNEKTNPLVGIMYGGYNGVFSKETTVGKEMKETMNGVLKSFSGKIKRSTNSKLQEYKKMDEVKKVEAEMETEIYIKEQKVYNAIKEKRKNKEDIDNGFLRDIIKENFEKKDWEKYGRKFSTYAKNANIDRSILDLIYEDTPEVQAYKIFSRYGDALDADENKELENAMKSARRRLNNKALSIYNKEYRKK